MTRERREVRQGGRRDKENTKAYWRKKGGERRWINLEKRKIKGESRGSKGRWQGSVSLPSHTHLVILCIIYIRYVG